MKSVLDNLNVQVKTVQNSILAAKEKIEVHSIQMDNTILELMELEKRLEEIKSAIKILGAPKENVSKQKQKSK